MADPQDEQHIAALDLGSNSFHMIVARLRLGQVRIVDRLREPVRLASGLDEQDRLAAEAAERALACLERFGQRVSGLSIGSVRAVGTNTLRKARDAGDFLTRARQALGHPIDVISGLEEARLIYQGVVHSLPDPEGRRLVVDIGGGSTEMIVGDARDPLHLDSLYMGCVSMSQRWFGGGRITRKKWNKAVMSARVELEPVVKTFLGMGWARSTGASGTIRAVRAVLDREKWSENDITLEGLHRLRDAILEAEHVDELKLKGLSDDRRPVFAGGVAILLAIFEDLGIESMEVSDGALREGLLHDLIGRIQHHDIREQTVAAMMHRHHIDGEHASRVEHSALQLLQQVAADWSCAGEEPERLLRWAARLHEVGLVIAHSQYHKHGAYLLANADMPWFLAEDQALLASLVRGHRRKFPQSEYRKGTSEAAESGEKLAVLLRTAVLLHRSRAADPLPECKVKAGEQRLRLRFTEGWLESRPLTSEDLASEAELLAAAGWRYEFQ